MDELTLTPVSKKEETPQENKESKSTSDYLEMDSISLNTNSSKDATEAAFEELDAKDIKSLMEQEKLERQKAKEAAANPAPAPAPAPVKPQSNENAKNKITEIMLTPPEDLKKEEPKAEEPKEAPKKEEVPQEKKEEKPSENQNKNANQSNNNNNNKNNKNKNKNNKGNNKNNNNNKPAPAPAPAPNANGVKKEEVKKGIEEIKIPDAMMNENKKVEPVAQKPQAQSNLESIETKKPVLVDVDENVAHAVGGMSFDDEFALLVKKEEQDALTPDESRRLKICRLIDMKKKGKPFSEVAQTNFSKFMDEERKAGHDISTFEAAMADIAIADASSGKIMSNPSTSDLAPINNSKSTIPVQKKEPQKPVAKKEEKMGSDNKVLFVIIAIIAVLIIGLLVIIFAGKDKDTPDVPVDTTIVTEATTTTPEETTTPKAETTPILSANNITKATVLEVIAPDTLKVLLKDNSQATVKLIGVKAPVDDEYYAKESLEYTKNALTSKNINLEFDQKLTDDEHNILAYVWTNDGKTLFNDELIVMGYAKANLDEEDNVKFNEEFTRVEEEAKTAKKGVWGYVAPVYTTTTKKPAVDPNKMFDSPYVSRNLKVFHRNTCPLAYDEKYGKAIYRFESREEAIKYGCSPCSQCQP